jgi:transposase-like protein
MNTYKRHRFPPDIIPYAVWLYHRFNLSHRRCAGSFIEDLLAERGIEVIDVFLQARRDGTTAKRFFKRLLRRHAQRFLGAHAEVHNLFNLGRHLARAQHYRDLRVSAFAEWGRAVA